MTRNQALKKYEQYKPWYEFVAKYEGCEPADYARSLLGVLWHYADDIAIIKLAELMEAEVTSWRKDPCDWFGEMVQRAQEEHDRWLELYSEKEQKRLTIGMTTPTENYQALLRHDNS